MIKDNVKNQILNSLNDIIFITDENFKIEWINSPGIKFFGSSLTGKNLAETINVKHDDLLQSRTDIESAVLSKAKQKHLFSSRLITTGNLKKESSFLVICRDITEKTKNENLLRSMIQFENLLTRIALESGNIPAEKIDSQLNRILMFIGEFALIDRAYIALLSADGEKIEIKYEWTSPFFKATINCTQSSHIPYSWSRKKRSEIIMLPDVQKAKYPEGVHHKQVFSKGTVSAMLVPLYQNSRFLGYLGFSSSKNIFRFPQELTSAFKITAEIIINLFEKKSSIDLIDLNKKIVSKTSGMMAYTDIDGKVLMYNEAFSTFHNEKNLLKEKNPELLLLYTDSISSGKENFISAFENCKKGLESKTEIWINRNNSLRLLEVFFHPILQSRDNITGIIFNSNDITERVQLEARILEVIHTERKKIGISLHDDLGHDLLAVAIKSRLIYDKLKTISPELSDEVKEIEKSIKYAIDEVRRLSRGLIPYKNSGLDFREMLDAIALTIERDYNLECSFTIDKNISINDESIIKEIFYIIDEAVMNCLKHSSCSRITIEMSMENSMIMLKVIDNGRGIDNNKSRFEGVGLEIMNYRARALGGGLEISRNPDGGTIIKCIFSPVKIQA